MLGYFGSLEDKQIAEDGIETFAAIVNKGQVNDRDQQRYFWDLVFFDLRSNRHEAIRHFNKGLWESFQAADTVPVKYLPSEPIKVRLVREIADLNELLYGLGVVGAGIALSGLGFTLYARMQRPGPVTAGIYQEVTGANQLDSELIPVLVRK